MLFHNGISYYYHFIKKELAKEFEEEFVCLGEYLINYNLLMAQDLRQFYYQFLLIILQKKFVKLNANMDMVIKSMKRVELNTNVLNAALNRQT